MRALMQRNAPTYEAGVWRDVGSSPIDRDGGPADTGAHANDTSHRLSRADRPCLASAMLPLAVVVVNTAIPHVSLTRPGFVGGRSDSGAGLLATQLKPAGATPY